METIIAVLLCVPGPLFFLTTVGLSALLYSIRKQSRTEREGHQSDAMRLCAQIDTLQSQAAALESQVAATAADAIKHVRQEWLDELRTTSYGSEIEVEMKFIYPLMRFLGYGADELRTRVLVTVPVGRQRITGVADWVVYDSRTEKAVLIIEAKEPSQPLDSTVQEQARSYAYALGVSLYMLANGREIRIYRRQVEMDASLLSVSAEQIESQWGRLVEVIGRTGKQTVPQEIGERFVVAAHTMQKGEGA